MSLPIDPGLLLNAATTAPKPAAGGDPAALRRSCQQFEAIFLQTLFKGMRATVGDGGLLEKGTDREIFQDLLDLQVAQSAASRNALGIGELLYRQLRTDENAE